MQARLLIRRIDRSWPLDALVYELYVLTEEEIALVEKQNCRDFQTRHRQLSNTCTVFKKQ